MLKADFAYRDARLPRVQFTSINVSLTRGRSRVEFLPRNYHFLTLYNPTSSAQSFALVARLVWFVPLVAFLFVFSGGILDISYANVMSLVRWNF